jgi:hypothetical protein
MGITMTRRSNDLNFEYSNATIAPFGRTNEQVRFAARRQQVQLPAKTVHEVARRAPSGKIPVEA